MPSFFFDFLTALLTISCPRSLLHENTANYVKKKILNILLNKEIYYLNFDPKTTSPPYQSHASNSLSATISLLKFTYFLKVL